MDSNVFLLDRVTQRYTDFSSFEDLVQHHKMNVGDLNIDIRGFDMADDDYEALINFEAAFWFIMKQWAKPNQVSVICTGSQIAKLRGIEARVVAA